jgi:hypothetical protein
MAVSQVKPVSAQVHTLSITISFPLTELIVWLMDIPAEDGGASELAQHK